MKIVLTEEESNYALKIGIQRNQGQRNAGMVDGQIDKSKTSLALDVIGARGEMAVAKALGLPWTGDIMEHRVWLKWRETGSDVGPLEVRTRNESFGGLLIYPRDKENAPFIFVMSHLAPEYEIVGWLWGSEGKQKKYWRSDLKRPCYLIPREHLRAMEELVLV